MAVGKKHILRGDFWAVLCAISTGCGLAIAKIILDDIPPIVFNCYLFLIGSIIILFDSALNKKIRETIIVSPKQLGFLLTITLIFSMAIFFLFTALTLSEPATVSFLSRIELIATIILAALFLKEKMNRNELWGLGLVIIGIIVMLYGASIELSKAILLVTLSSILIGTAEVMTKSRITWINHRSYIFYRGILISIIFLIASLISGEFVWVGNDYKLWGLLFLCGLLLPYLGRMSYLIAMKYISISRASIIVQSQPFFVAAATLLIIGTLPPLREITGGLLIISGVILIKLLEKRLN